MRIKMRRPYARLDDALDLRAELALDYFDPHSFTHQHLHQIGERARQPSFIINERADFTGWRNGATADGGQVAPNAQTGICARKLDCILEGIAVGHDGRARQYAFPESAHDA